MKSVRPPPLATAARHDFGKAVETRPAQMEGRYRGLLEAAHDAAAEADIVKSDQLQPNCYLSKPVQFDAFESLVKSIDDFWLTKVKLPRREQRR